MNKIFDGRKHNDIIDFSSVLKDQHSTGRLIGIDHGTKNIGIALSDESQTIATSWETYKTKTSSKTKTHLQELIQKERAKGLVIGLPINMNGSIGARAQSALSFAQNLKSIINVPIIMWDERQTSVIAHNAMIKADLSRNKQKQKIDRIAACLILQSLLDRLKNITN